MRVEKYIVSKFAGRIEKAIIARARHSLAQLEGGTSGDDSPLRNVWDEICAQQQGEKSWYWTAYEEIIDQILLDRISRLDRAALLALWTQTDDGFDWLYEHHADVDGLDQAPVDPDAVVVYLKGRLIRVATDEDNQRVRKYLYPMEEESDNDDTWP